MFMNLWRAEWLKTRRRPANLGIMAVMVLMVVGITFIRAFYSLSQGTSSEEAINSLHDFVFPNAVMFALLIVGQLGWILGIIFMANSVGSEYSRDTWKMILPRQGSRIMFVVVKLLIALAFMLLLILVTMLAAQIAGWLGVLLLGGSFSSTTAFSLATFSQSLVPILMNIGLFACITLLAAVVTRSSIGGIVIGFVVYVVFNLARISTIASRIVPVTHLDNLNRTWLYTHFAAEDQAQAQANVTEQFGMQISPTTSLIVVLGYVFGCIALALFIFRKRDMAGQ
jgi:ABC-type transport system involved in multi-copper enzyme maturation permease subunit